MPTDISPLPGSDGEPDRLQPHDPPDATRSGRGAIDSRRDFMKKVGVGGALVTVGALAAPLATAGAAPASAQAPAAAGDLTSDELLAFAMGIEYVGAQLYQLAGAKGSLDAAAATMVTTFGDHHQAHGDSFASLLGADDASKVPNKKLLDERSPTVDRAADQKAVLRALLAWEDTIAATYQSLLATTPDRTDAESLATVLAVEAQHAVSIGSLLKDTLDTLVPDSEPETGALDPAKYPTKVAVTATPPA
ncbi:MAG: Ferritin-like domain [Acidimicrobiales bacterium]|nr:Ferritin-like domain [Acidimicrobiales bacterium]